MAGITLEQAETKLALWLEADDLVATGQGYSIEGRSLTRADAEEIRENIEFWDGKVKELTENAGGGLITSQISILDS
jgi:hypothetical protein